MAFQSHPITNIRDRVKAAQIATEQIILDTPTGKKRDTLTEANIHLLLAYDKLQESLQGS